MFNFKALLVGITILVLAGATYAFAAANTVPNTQAGDGSGTITGYDIIDVVYNLNTTNPSLLDSVDFNVQDPAVTVKIQLITAGAWYDCTNTSTTIWNCVTTGVTVSGITQLRVVATSN